MKAIGIYIFGGSQTIGHLLEGWSINTILEMTENMPEQNSYHFIKNYPNIHVLKPSEYYNNDSYFNKLENDNYDLLFANPPCSGLSSINRNASVTNAINYHLYEVIDMVNRIKPKVFLIENAPTLTTLGLPILKNMVKRLSNYKLLIINDCAKNHNVAMFRRRTFVIGFNNKYFNRIPAIKTYSNNIITVKDVLGSVDYKYNKEFIDSKYGTDESLFKYYDLVKPNSSLYRALATSNIDIEMLPDKLKKPIKTIRDKLNKNISIWDKSPWRLGEDQMFQSMTSVTRFIHPTENRDLYIREYATIMGYPNEFIFYPNECKVSTIQCVAQGVPVNFIRYISKEIMESFNSTNFINGDIVYINQCNPDRVKSKSYSKQDFLDIETII